MQLPHRFLIVTPNPVTDAYGNPTPELDYGPDAARRVMWGNLQSAGSSEAAEPGRRPVVTAWRLFSIEPVTARQRIEWRGLVLEVDGEPDRFEPRFGLVSYETRLKHVQG
ncbi:hypothetical protein ACQPZF_03535 [Actinosynnema sp. CS-041913]|uniref:hypothetical protein n=1 Tax=Actinosynnema sp. CS-041913 TaxID=3239917 RepID=UPI003D91A1AF